MKKLLLGCVVAAASVASANVFDDALVWRQGESLDPNGEFTQATESVPATWNGKETMQTVLKINQTKTEKVSIPISDILPANCHKLTMYMRCKWDGDFFSGSRAYLFQYGNSWNQYRGSNFSFINLTDGTASVRWDCGRHQAQQTSPTILPDTWYDVFMTIEDPSPSATAAHNVYTHAYLLKDEAQMIKFSLTKGQAALAYRYEISTRQTKDAKGPKFVIYVNGVESKRISVAWQYGNADWMFPAGTFREGENTIAIRYDPADYPDGYWAGFRGHRLTVVKDSFPKFGMFLVVR